MESKRFIRDGKAHGLVLLTREVNLLCRCVPRRRASTRVGFERVLGPTGLRVNPGYTLKNLQPLSPVCSCRSPALTGDTGLLSKASTAGSKADSVLVTDSSHISAIMA